MKRRSIAAMILATALVSAALIVLPAGSNVTPAYSADVSKKLIENRPTLPPAFFTGPTAEAYRIAQEIPEVIDKLYCWCQCKENPNFKHKNLLSCYVDQHASFCDICMNSTAIAYTMHKQGKSTEEIQAVLDEKYSRGRKRN